MISEGRAARITRRDAIRSLGTIAGATLVVPFVPAPAWASHVGVMQAQTPAAPPSDPVAALRAQMGAVPIETIKLTDSLTMLSGPGGNVLVINGKDGKVLVDAFVQPAFANLKNLIDGMGSTPVKTLIDTHWHIDHADNNENFRKAGAAVVAHEKTKTRLSQSHDLLGMHFPASPAGARTCRPNSSFSAARRKRNILPLGHPASVG